MSDARAALRARLRAIDALLLTVESSDGWSQSRLTDGIRYAPDEDSGAAENPAPDDVMPSSHGP